MVNTKIVLLIYWFKTLRDTLKQFDSTELSPVTRQSKYEFDIHQGHNIEDFRPPVNIVSSFLM